MSEKERSDKPFPLKRYYLLYGIAGSVLFYALLFSLFLRSERRALYEEYAHSVAEKARSTYLDIERDFLLPNSISLDQVDPGMPEVLQGLRHEIGAIVRGNFEIAKVKLFRTDAMTLYDHTAPENVGRLYEMRDHYGFKAALEGKAHTMIELQDGRRYMEAYLPIRKQGSEKVVAVLELYDDVSRFEDQVQKAMRGTLLLPTLVFLFFNVVLYLIVAKADRIIADDRNFIVTMQRNMEKYLSPSAVEAINRSFSGEKGVPGGGRENLVVLFSDIRGFSAYAEAVDPEKVVHTLNRLLEIQAGIIHGRGGVIDKFVGDQVMAIFPAGGEEEAVAVAMGILESVGDSEEEGLGVGIGIHGGEAVVGSLGTPERRDYTAIGDTINIAAGLCSVCPAGWLYVSAALFGRLTPETQGRFSDGGPVHLKGRSEPLQVHPYAAPQQGAAPPSAPGGDVPSGGRRD